MPKKWISIKQKIYNTALIHMRKNARIRRNNSILHVSLGIIGVRNPMHLTHVRCLHKGHSELSHLLYLPSFACSQHKMVFIVRENSIRQSDNVPRVKCITLFPPQLEVNCSRLICHKCQTCLVLAFHCHPAFDQKYELRVYVVLCCWHHVFNRQHPLQSG